MELNSSGLGGNYDISISPLVKSSVTNAKTVRPDNVVSDGPYSEMKEFISGYMVVKTATVEEAIKIARANPILKGGGNIEIRPVLTPEDNA